MDLYRRFFLQVVTTQSTNTLTSISARLSFSRYQKWRHNQYFVMFFCLTQRRTAPSHYIITLGRKVGEEEKLHDLLTFTYLIEVIYQIRELYNFYLTKCSFTFSVKQQPKSSLGLLVVEASRSHTHTHARTRTHRSPLNK